MKKKRVLVLLLIAAVCLGLYSLGAVRGNTMFTIQTIESPGEHSRASVRDAMRMVKKEFRNEYEGCTLLTLYYDPVRTEKETKPEEADEMIVLGCTFYTGLYDVNVLPVWGANQIHKGYGWKLCRYGDRWVIESRGYA